MDDACSLDGCSRAVARRGYCQTHYKRLLKTGDPGPAAIKRRVTPPDECIVDGCTRGARGGGGGHGYCGTHYTRWRKHGDAGPGDIRHWDYAPDTCSVEGCEGEPHARGLCSTHHARWLKHGDPGPAELLHKPMGPCVFPGCDNPRNTEGYCTTHHARILRYGDPAVVQYSGFKGDEVGYLGMHCRLREKRGNADTYPCSMCNRQAKDWAYAHTDKAVRYDPKTGYPYSLKISHYIPLCRSCHKRLDARMIRR